MKEKDKEQIPEEEIPEEQTETAQPEKTATNDVDEQMESLRTTIARLQADFANYKSRTEREHSDRMRLSNEGLIQKLLPVVDNFERAFTDQDPEDPGCAGFHMIYKELMEILQKEGVSAVDSDHQPFDPNLHHALFLEESDEIEPDHIIETFQKGYRIGDKLIRPAMVKVSKQKA